MPRLAAATVALALVTIATLAAFPAPAAAGDIVWDKRGKFAGTAQLGLSHRAIVPFDREYCGEDDADKEYCVGRGPVVFQLGGAYGLTRNLEAILSFGLGLHGDFGTGPNDDDGPHLLAINPGLKLYLSPLGPGELAATLELPFDFTDYPQAGGVDVGIRNRNTFEFPLARHISGQLYLGETATWLRWFRFEVDFGVGLVVRR